MKHKVMRLTTFILVVFGALATISGGIGLLTGAIATPREWLVGSPFSDYTLPGLSLLVIVGGSMTLASATILTRHEIGVLAAAFAGLAMIVFEIVEVAVIDHISGSDLLIALVLQSIFFVLGLAIFVLASILWISEYRSQHFLNRTIRHA